MSLTEILTKLNNYEDFAKQYRSNGNGFNLGNHQLVPIFDAVENGLRRFLLAYGTGAGKTIIPIEILKHLQKKKEPCKTLVIAPYQTILENWNEELLALSGLSLNIHRIEYREDINIPSRSDFVVVNYDKLGKRRVYHKGLIDYVKDIGLLIVDEGHNMKNNKGVRSRAFQQIIEQSKNARMVVLSASPCPDRLKDMGMILFMIDPDRYNVYKDAPFSAEDDPEAIWEMREKGFIRFFNRDEVAKFHNLPELIEREPMNVEMNSEYIQKYFEVFKNSFTLGSSLSSLERISIESMIHSEKFKEEIKKKVNEGYVLNFFSHLRNPPKGGHPEQAIFAQLENKIKEINKELRIRYIHGDIGKKERLYIQDELAKGNVDILINQWDCTQEGFSEVAGSRPVSIIPLRSPFSPGVQMQIIGRAYRPGQFAKVEYVEFHPESEVLCDRIDDFVRDFAAKNHIRIKTNWSPSLFHKDSYLIRKGKEEKIKLLLMQRGHIEIDDDRLNVDSVMNYTKLLSKERILDFSDISHYFGSGIRSAIQFVGVPYEQGLVNNVDPLGKDYDRDNILLYAPGKINLFLAEVVDKLKKNNESWKIADLGCCSSAVFSQARILWQLLNNQGLDYIVNVDGQKGLVNSARRYFENKQWINVVKEIEMQGFSKKDFNRVYNHLKNLDYMKNLEFRQANFTKDDFGNDYDIVITSQCLQYNDQTDNRDIEKIVMNINHSLKKGGHYLTVLTGNTFNNSFTKPQDVNSFVEILENYGFNLESAEHIQGKSRDKVVLKPFHFIHAVKEREHNKGYAPFEIIPPMYIPSIIVLTGGVKFERHKHAVPKKEETLIYFPDKFVNQKGEQYKI